LLSHIGENEGIPEALENDGHGIFERSKKEPETIEEQLEGKRKPPQGFNPDEVFCFKYHRTVGQDNVVRFGGHRLQIMPTNGRSSYARAKVEVHERMDGSFAVYYKGQCLLTKPAPAEAPVLRARSMERVASDTTEYRELSAISAITKKTSEPQASRYTKPGPNHPWRKPFKVHIDKG